MTCCTTRGRAPVNDCARGLRSAVAAASYIRLPSEIEGVQPLGLLTLLGHSPAIRTRTAGKRAAEKTERARQDDGPAAGACSCPIRPDPRTCSPRACSTYARCSQSPRRTFTSGTKNRTS